MTAPRPLMVFRDRRDRVVIPQQQQQHLGHPMNTTAVGFQTLHPYLSRPHRFDGDEGEIGRIGRGGGGGDGSISWAVAAREHQQMELAAATLRRQRVGTSRPPLPPLMHQCHSPGQTLDWDCGGRLAVHDIVSSSRLDSNILLDDNGRFRQPTVIAGVEFPRGITREVYAEFKAREERDKIFPDREFTEPAHSSFLGDSRSIEMPRTYQRVAAPVPVKSPGRFRGMFGGEESGHVDLISRYHTRSSSRALERAHGAIMPPAQSSRVSRKRCRDEEDFESGRLQRHRKISGVDCPSDIRLQATGQRAVNEHKADYISTWVDDDEREEGQFTPSPPKVSYKSQLHEIEQNNPLFEHETNTSTSFRSEVTSKLEGNSVRYQNALAFSRLRESPLISVAKSFSTPSTAREIGKAQCKIPGSTRDQNLTNRERQTSPRYKDNERKVTRLDRSGGAVESYFLQQSDSSRILRKEFESYSFLPSDFSRKTHKEFESYSFPSDCSRKMNKDFVSYSFQPSDTSGLSRRMNKELESHTRLMNSKPADRRQDAVHCKVQIGPVDNTPQRNIRTPPSRRKNRVGSESLDNHFLERFSKESSRRIESDFVQKSPQTCGLKDSRLAGELTISVQKHGQRTVKVEEHRPRDSSFRGTSQSTKEDRDYRGSRGGSRAQKVSETERERLNLVRRESKGRPISAACENDFRPQSSKGGTISLQHSMRYLTHGGAPPSSDHLKNEIQPTTKYGVESQRQQSIFSRLVGLNRDCTTPPRTGSETFRQESSVPEVNVRFSVSSSSKELPTAIPDEPSENIVHFEEFPTPIDTGSSPDGVNSLLTSIKEHGLDLDLPRCCLQVELCDRLTKPSLPSLDVLKRDEMATRENRDLSVSRSPHITRKVNSPVESEPEDLHKDTGPLESALVCIPDHVMECVPSPCSDTGMKDMVTTEVPDLLQGNAFRPSPKVIATGHKKDQVWRKELLVVDDIGHGLSSLAEMDVAISEKLSQENCKRNISSESVELMPSVSGCTHDPVIHNSFDHLCESVALLADSDLTMRPTLGDMKPIGINRCVETGPKPNGYAKSTSPGPTCTLPVSHALNSIDDNIMKPSQASEVSSVSQGYQECCSLHVISQHIIDGETEKGSSISPVASSTSSKRMEVRLFGANLNAPMLDQVEQAQSGLELVDENVGQDIVGTFVSSVANDVAVPGPLERISISCASIQESEKDAAQQEVLKVDEHQNEPLKRAEEAVIQLGKEPRFLGCDSSDRKRQVEKPAFVAKEQYISPPNLQKNSAAVRGRQSSSHGPGSHTWRRSASRTTPDNSASFMRHTNAFVGMTHPAVRAGSIEYVRKGNSLVRAPGIVSTLLPAKDLNAGTIGRSALARPLQRSFPVKPNPYRNSFKAKPFFPTHRKYIAPSMEANGGIASVSRSAKPGSPTNIPLGTFEACMHTIPHSALLEGTPPFPSKTSSMNATPILTSNGDQHTTGVVAIDIPVADQTGRLSEALTCRPANIGSSVTHVPSTPNPSSFLNQLPAPGNTLYVRRKANQLLVAPTQPADFIPIETLTGTGKINTSPGVYYKRKTNQLVRRNGGKTGSSQSFVKDVLGKGLSLDIANEQVGGNTLVQKKTRLGRVLRQKKHCAGPSSWVWTLSGATGKNSGDEVDQTLQTEPSLFPWKRQNSLMAPARSQRIKLLQDRKKGSLLFLMSKRLRKAQPVQPVYTRLADGFSLRRSGVLSLGGGNLKWTKSLEKRAKQANEAATKAVAEAERRKREKKEQDIEVAAKVKSDRKAVRKASEGGGEQIVWIGLLRYLMDATSKTLQPMPEMEGNGLIDQDSADIVGDATVPTGLIKTEPLLTPRRSIIGGMHYLRVGNGNQLVRDPKAASRALASEKVRWSLHNARSRGAKKQQYCQFFTKFGKCDKQNGKCNYIHDPEKVAVCTKFLKGNCTEANCLLTHKIIPERMQDCSFFLEGLCTNENCPYRHVNVNPKAPYCDGFLRGYCKDGDKCNKKHTFVCPVYAETGDCLERATCKFHHPKKKISFCEPLHCHKIGAKRKRRYFSTIESDLIRKEIASANSSRDKVIEMDDGSPPGEESLDFISLSNIDSDDDQNDLVEAQSSWPSSGFTSRMNEAGFAGDLEKWIKPMFLLQGTTAAT